MASRFAPNFSNARPSGVALPAIQAPTVSATWSRSASRAGATPPRATWAPSCSRTVMLRGRVSSAVRGSRPGRPKDLPSAPRRTGRAPPPSTRTPPARPAHALRVALERLAPSAAAPGAHDDIGIRAHRLVAAVHHSVFALPGAAQVVASALAGSAAPQAPRGTPAAGRALEGPFSVAQGADLPVAA